MYRKKSPPRMERLPKKRIPINYDPVITINDSPITIDDSPILIDVVKPTNKNYDPTAINLITPTSIESEKSIFEIGEEEFLGFFKEGIEDVEEGLKKLKNEFVEKMIQSEKAGEEIYKEFAEWFNSKIWDRPLNQIVDWRKFIDEAGRINMDIYNEVDEFIKQALDKKFIHYILDDVVSMRKFIRIYSTKVSADIYLNLRKNINVIQETFTKDIGKIIPEQFDRIESFIMLKLKQSVLKDEGLYNTVNLIEKTNRFKTYFENMNSPEFENLVYKFLEFLKNLPGVKWIIGNESIISFLGSLLELPLFIQIPVGALLLLFILISLVYVSEIQFNYFVDLIFGININNIVKNELKSLIKKYLRSLPGFKKK